MKFQQFVEKYEDIPTEKRTWSNIPRYATGKFKVPFTEWLGLKGQGSKGYDGKYYGWSHRAVYGFSVGDTVKKGDIGYDGDGEPYVLDTEEKAKAQALKFHNEIS